MQRIASHGQAHGHGNTTAERLRQKRNSLVGVLMCNPAEEWRRVPGWPSYEISSLGRVRRGPRCLKPWRLANGRWQIRLSDRKRVKSFNTYRLVALAFLGDAPFPGAEVAHKDDDKDNNSLSNLKWCSHQENCADRRRNGKAPIGFRNGAYTQPHRVPRGETNGTAKLTWQAVKEIRQAKGGLDALANKFGVSRTTIKDVRRGHTWKVAP